MPSTYSNIKIQLMATGENNTTWGNVTNINLGTALEEAIVGSADVTFASANVTLTLTDTNASQTARHMRLRCTGVTGGSTRNLVVPAIEKPYIVQNDCSDSILVKTAAGNGITVPAGKTMWVYSDGTNVVNTTTHLSSLTLGTDLAVADGGTGASTFTANGVLLGNGTSAIQATAVGATGQVLVGNTGAAPSWTALSGIGVTSLSFGSTGLTPATATTGAITVAGTLGVANGGTGTATAFTAGSVVFAGASGVYTQSNSNLFWDNVNGRLGVGTSSPAYRLDVAGGGGVRLSNASPLNWNNSSGVARPVLQIFSDNNLYLDAEDGAQIFRTLGSERMRITAAGNVGIGASSPLGKLHINGNFIRIDQSGSNLAFFGNAADLITGAPAGAGIRFDGTALRIASVSSEIAQFDSAGNFGIGLTPTAKLHVAGTIQSSSGSTTAQMFADGSAAYFTSVGAFPSIFTTNAAERMRITAAGNVGIGTSSPGTPLDVTGTTRSGNFRVNAGGSVTGAGMWGIDTILAFNTGSTERMRIDSSGNVGIGTATPPLKFVVSNAGAAGLEIDPTAVASAPVIQAYNRSGAAYTQLTYSALQHVFQISGTEQMRIDASGNVGIGTSSPAARLDLGAYTGPALGTTMMAMQDGWLDIKTSSIVVGSRYLYGSTVYGRAFANVTGFNLDTGSAAVPLVFGTNNTERMRIDGSGNVMIGTTAANNKFLVTYANPVTVPAAGTGGHCTAFGTVGYGLATGALTNGNAYLQATRWDALATNYDLLLQPNGGNVGIGTSTPSYPLEVRQDGASSANYIGSVNTTATGSSGAAGYLARAGSNFAYFYVRGDGVAYIDNATANPLVFATNGSERMRITSSGTVGIGTSTPNGKLTVAGSITAFTTGVTDQLLMEPLTAGSGSLILSVNDANNAYRDLTLNASTQIFKISNTERARIDGSGNLLVGTTSSSGSASNTAKVIGGVFSTLRSSASIPHNTATTIATLPSGDGNYMVSAALVNSASPASYNEVAIVGVSQSTAAITVLVNASALSLSMSGLDLQVTQGQGTTQTVEYSVLRIL